MRAPAVWQGISDKREPTPCSPGGDRVQGREPAGPAVVCGGSGAQTGTRDRLTERLLQELPSHHHALDCAWAGRMKSDLAQAQPGDGVQACSLLRPPPVILWMDMAVPYAGG